MLDNKLNIPHPTVTIARSLTEGAMLGVYKYSSYITDAKKKSTLKSITIIPPSKKDVEEIKRETSRTEILCNAVIFTRNLANAPGSEIYPESLAAAVQKECGGAGCKVTILGEKKIASLKMGGMLGVSKGSARQPRFIVVEWNGGGRRDKPVVLIGKGITFDTGGISLKPSAQMGDMKMDMSGAAAVAGTMHAAASLKIKKNVIGLIPACENMPSGTAMRPGDILRMMNGLTVEVDNTDAEGRLVLADALVFAKRYKPEAVVDVATLTGACVVALGHHATGIMGNDKNLIAQLKDAGDRTYERVWELPLFDEYEKQIQSNVADIKNIGGRWGGTITAAWFLKKFVDDFPWAHLDIAGTAILDTDSYYTQKGASGVGVRLLTEWLENKVDR